MTSVVGGLSRHGGTWAASLTVETARLQVGGNWVGVLFAYLDVPDNLIETWEGLWNLLCRNSLLLPLNICRVVSGSMDDPSLNFVALFFQSSL